MRNLLLVDMNGARDWAASRVRAVGSLPQLDVGADFEREIRAAADSRAAGVKQSDTVVIQIQGPISYRLDMWGYYFGGMSTLSLTQAINRYAADDSVSRIVLDIDSPGGEYLGLPEAAAAIMRCRESKEIVACCNPYAASAAVWLATAASRVVCLGSGFVGSIGSLVVLSSFARFYEQEGIDIKVVRNPPAKAENNSLEPLTEAGVQNVQDMVDRITGEFHAAVAKHRGVKAGEVKSNYGQGRMLDAAAAKSAGLIDGIMTLDEVLAQKPKRPAKKAESGRAARLAFSRRSFLQMR